MKSAKLSRKIIAIALVACMAASGAVTASAISSSEAKEHTFGVTGAFEGCDIWCTDIRMTDIDGDGMYTVKITGQEPGEYEFKIRAENAYTEYDVIYALKQINARLSLLDDYIYNNPDEADIERWKMLKYQYMSIRDTLAKKKLVNRNYSIFIDYDKLYSRNPNQ